MPKVLWKIIRNELFFFLWLAIVTFALRHAFGITASMSTHVLFISVFSIAFATYLKERKDRQNVVDGTTKIVKIGPIPIVIEGKGKRKGNSMPNKQKDRG